MPWFAPSMFASIYYMTLKIDYFDYFRKLNSRAKIALSLFFSAIFGGSAILFSVVIMQSLLINQIASSFFRWPLAVIVTAVLFGKNLVNELIDLRLVKKNSTVTMEVESIYVARVLSPSFSLFIWIGALGTAYVWTQQLVPALVASVFLVLPYLLLFVTFPEFAGRKLPSFPRNITIEASLLAILTGIVFFAIEKLPMAVIQKSKAFILIAVIPVALHGIYSVVVDSSERAKRKTEEAKGGEVNA
jgi:hypothetical protein